MALRRLLIDEEYACDFEFCFHPLNNLTSVHCMALIDIAKQTKVAIDESHI